MSLLIQLNADLQQYFPNDQRRLQVWVCRRKTCARKPGSIRVLREVKRGEKTRASTAHNSIPTAQKPDLDLGSSLFGGSASSMSNNANPFSSNASLSNTSPNIFGGLDTTALAAKPPQLPPSDVQPPSETFAQKLKIDDNATAKPPISDPWPEVDKFPEPYKFFHLDAYPEELEPTPEETSKSSAGSSKAQYDVEDNSSSMLDKDAYESSLDKTFQKFSDVISQNPEQVLRYEFKGQPLLYSGSDGVASRFVVPHGKAGAVKGIPRCELCGSQRVFEMQLTPHLIFEMEKDEAIDIDSGMEWGTIIVGTCIDNCGDEGTVSFQEEWAGVQWEERVVRR